RLSTAREGELPRLRRPLRREIERDLVDVLQSVLLEHALDPRLRRVVPRRADVAAPEQISAVAILQRNGVDLHQQLFQMAAVDVAVLAIFRKERGLQHGVITHEAVGIEERLAESIGFGGWRLRTLGSRGLRSRLLRPDGDGNAGADE